MTRRGHPDKKTPRAEAKQEIATADQHRRSAHHGLAANPIQQESDDNVRDQRAQLEDPQDEARPTGAELPLRGQDGDEDGKGEAGLMGEGLAKTEGSEPARPGLTHRRLPGPTTARRGRRRALPGSGRSASPRSP